MNSMFSPLAVIEADRIGENVLIREFAIVRRGAVIGNNVVIHPFVIIEDGVRIGDRGGEERAGIARR